MRTPITHHEHLHSRRRIPGNGEELGRSNSFRPFIADTHADFSLVYFYRIVDIAISRSFALDFESLRCEIPSAPKSGRKRNFCAAICELEIHFHTQRIAVTRDFVTLLADRLLEFVQSELASLQDGRFNFAGSLLTQQRG